MNHYPISAATGIGPHYNHPTIGGKRVLGLSEQQVVAILGVADGKGLEKLRHRLLPKRWRPGFRMYEDFKAFMDRLVRLSKKPAEARVELIEEEAEADADLRALALRAGIL